MFWTPAKLFLEQPFTPEAGPMPHPERACKLLLGSDDSKWIFESIFAALEKRTAAKAA